MSTTTEIIVNGAIVLSVCAIIMTIVYLKFRRGVATKLFAHTVPAIAVEQSGQDTAKASQDLEQSVQALQSLGKNLETFVTGQAR